MKASSRTEVIAADIAAFDNIRLCSESLDLIEAAIQSAEREAFEAGVEKAAECVTALYVDNLSMPVPTYDEWHKERDDE